jgi:hypothetical protein
LVGSLPATIVGGLPATIDGFMLACVIRTKGSKVSWAELSTRYPRWCTEQAPDFGPLDPATFGRRLDAFRNVGIIRVCRQGQDGFVSMWS